MLNLAKLIPKILIILNFFNESVHFKGIIGAINKQNLNFSIISLNFVEQVINFLITKISNKFSSMLCKFYDNILIRIFSHSIARPLLTRHTTCI